MRTVLLVTDHQDLAAFAKEMEANGLSAQVMESVLFHADKSVPRVDAIVLDMRGVPGGLSLSGRALKDLKESGIACVLTIEPTDIERLPVDSAAEDFLVLPASAIELSRRVERAIWKKHGVDSDNRLDCGSLQIDLSNYRVSVHDESVVLTFKEYELLRFLALNSGRVFTREQLLNRVWGYDYFGGARTVDVHIRRIRSKIEVQGDTFIETVRNVGYRLVIEGRTQSAET
ncbi:MAG TPA: response regulator transcription factor [Dehalococcoidia bacterium]|nr:response regulator transcription factor [Dehalococcoidia bacterium]